MDLPQGNSVGRTDLYLGSDPIPMRTNFATTCSSHGIPSWLRISTRVNRVIVPHEKHLEYTNTGGERCEALACCRKPARSLMVTSRPTSPFPESHWWQRRETVPIALTGKGKHQDTRSGQHRFEEKDGKASTNPPGSSTLLAIFRRSLSQLPLEVRPLHREDPAHLTRLPRVGRKTQFVERSYD